MSCNAFATSDDLEDLWRPLTQPEKDRADRQLELASALLRARKSLRLDIRIAAGTIDPTIVAIATCQMVQRKMRNVDGFISEADGDYNYQLDRAIASGKLEVTGDELSLLQEPFTGTIHSRAGLADLGDRRMRL